jgi:DNA polymerase-3 subunit alpha
MPSLYEKYKKLQTADAEGQLDIFAKTMGNGEQQRNITKSPLPKVDPAPNPQRIEWEKELLGMYTSSHPIANIRPYLDSIKALKISELRELRPETKVKVGALISNVKRITTRKSNKNMAFVEIEDQSNSIEVILFPSTYEKEAPKLRENTPTLFIGKINEREGEKSIICNSIKIIDHEKAKKVSEGIYLRISQEADQEKIQQLKRALLENPGDTPVTISFPDGKNIRTMQLKKGIEISPELEEIIAPFRVS